MDRGVVVRLRRELAEDPAVARVAAPRLSADRRSALLVAVPREDGESERTLGLVHRVRGEHAVAGAEVLVGGGPAGLEDINGMLADSMWKIVLFVLALSFVLVAVFQWGWVDGMFGFQPPGHVDG